jgi:glutamate synthase (ferredoxin)
VDLLEFKSDIVPWKAGDLDYSGILYGPEVTEDVGIRRLKAQDHGIGDVLDRKLIELSRPALEKGETVRIKKAIRNHNRTTGGMLSGEVCRLHGEKGLPEDSIYCKFKGEAGQSFGAWLARGVTFELEGMANDYVGKGMSGGKVIIYPNRKTTFISEENIIIGNTAFYGATDGEAYIRGLAGERFCIRNSGLNAVVEGVGDHGCEYMTGGRVLVLGKTGRNFAAGMSGGFAYVYDREGDFRDRCNLNMVELEEVDEDHAAAINSLLYNHHKCTGSPLAGKILENLSEELTSFVKVMPIEYKRVLEGMKV